MQRNNQTNRETAGSLQSVLWIGPGRGIAENGIYEAATLDVVWVRNVDEALTLSPNEFDVVVLAQHEFSKIADTLARLAPRPGIPPLLVIAEKRHVEALRSRLAVDAGEILVIDSQSVTAPVTASDDVAGGCTGAEAALVPVRDVRHRAQIIDVDRAAGASAASVSSNPRAPRLPDDRSTARLRRLLVSQIQHLARRRRERRPLSRRELSPTLAVHYPEIIGQSECMLECLELVERASKSMAAVLLSGETGTGKEVFARAIHRRGARAQGPFVPINCAALTDSLLESELFGHVKGAFTGASRDKPGLFELADGGTLFLDEIGETSPALQAKLLRSLQDKQIRPVGGGRVRQVDVRIVTATNRNLRSEVAQGRFREDLYYRLAILSISIPPLRKRGHDILLLARHFLELYGDDRLRGPRRLSQAAAQHLLGHSWPGNVRELENEVQRALALCDPGQLITPEQLSMQINEPMIDLDAGSRPGETLRQVVARVEGIVIRRALANNGGRRAITADQLGLTREGLYKKMKRLGID